MNSSIGRYSLSISGENVIPLFFDYAAQKGVEIEFEIEESVPQRGRSVGKREILMGAEETFFRLRTHSYSRRMSTALWPPKPKDWERPVRMG